MNFEGLVLGSIDASDSESRRILQHFQDPKSPLSGRKKSASTFLPPEKKEHLEDFTAEEVVRRKRPGGSVATSARPRVNVGSTFMSGRLVEKTGTPYGMPY